MSVLSRKKTYEATIKKNQAYVEGLMFGFNPFERERIDYDNHDEHFEYLIGRADGAEELERVEKHIERMVRGNISTDAYLSKTYLNTIP